MNALDHDLLRALGDADAALPPAPGVEVTTERIARLAVRRTARRVGAALAATLLLAAGAVLGTLRAPAADAATFAAELAKLRADVESLQAQCREHFAREARAVQDATAAAHRRAAASALRCDLAAVRADAALAAAHIRPVPETRR